MRAFDWLIRILIPVLVIYFLYQFVFTALPQLKAIKNQQPNRPSVEETLNKLDNGKAATLDAEDYDDEGMDLSDRMGSAADAVKDGVAASGTAVAGGVAAAGGLLKDGANTATNAVTNGASSLKAKAEAAAAATPSIDELVSLKEDQARELEAKGSRASASGGNTPVSYNSSPNGAFMIVAGTYRQMINAEKELKKLKSLGYDNASIAKFNKSTYASLIVDRFNTSSEAYAYLKTLKKNGMEAYVHKKR